MKDFQLMTRSDDLDLQISSPSEAGKEAVEMGPKDYVHAFNAMAHRRETPGFLCRMKFVEGTGETPRYSQTIASFQLQSPRFMI